jgi:hypothetical protein
MPPAQFADAYATVPMSFDPNAGTCECALPPGTTFPPAGDAFAILPPIVPRFWIWTPPICRAASTRIGNLFFTSGERTISV